MAKKKSKINQSISSVVDTTVDTNRSSKLLNDILNSDLLKEVGMAIAGVVVGELLDKAIERLVHKTTANPDTDSDDIALDADQAHPNHQNPIKQTVLAVTDNAAGLKDNIKESVAGAASQVREQGSHTKEMIQTLRATVSELTPDLSDVVAVLKNAALQSMQDSNRATEKTINHAVETVDSTKKSALNALNADRKGKKHKKAKKKHKRKDKSKSSFAAQDLISSQ